LDRGAHLDVPAIFQVTTLAPSGYGKSTVLGPLIEMVDGINKGGITRRGKIVASMASDAVAKIQSGLEAAGEGSGEGSFTAQEAAEIGAQISAWSKCNQLVVDTGTPESLRDAMSLNGSTLGVMTAEPDILREVASYSKDSGSLKWMLDGWDGAKALVQRVGRMIILPRTVMPYAIVIQPSSFDAFNASRTEKGGGGVDSIIGRGLYGRSWLTRVEGFGGGADAFSVSSASGAGMGVASPVVQATVALEEKLEALAAGSDEYRAEMGMAIAWENAAFKDVEGLWEYPGLPERCWFTMGSAAVQEYISVQNLRLAMMDVVAQMDAAAVGSSDIYNPMVTRITQHVLRVAMLLSLCDDPYRRDLPAWAIRDAGQRIVPWLFAAWCSEMRTYVDASARGALEQDVRSNPRGVDSSPEGQVIAAIVKSYPGADQEFYMSKIVNRVMQIRSNRIQGKVRPLVKEAFDSLVARGWLEKIERVQTKGSVTQKVLMYKRSDKGKQHIC
jgi:hypothetical protein